MEYHIKYRIGSVLKHKLNTEHIGMIIHINDNIMNDVYIRIPKLNKTLLYFKYEMNNSWEVMSY